MTNALSETSNIDELSRSGWRHIRLICLRLVLALPVAQAMPFAHEKWGEMYPGEGQQAFGFLIIFALIGLGTAVCYFVVGSTLQFLLRKRRAIWTVTADLALAIILAGALGYMGLTAHYADAPPAKAVQ